MKEVIEGLHNVISIGRLLMKPMAGGNQAGPNTGAAQPGQGNHWAAAPKEQISREILENLDRMERLLQGNGTTEATPKPKAHTITNPKNIGAGLPTNALWDNEAECVRFKSSTWFQPATSGSTCRRGGDSSRKGKGKATASTSSKKAVSTGRTTHETSLVLADEAANSEPTHRYGLRNRRVIPYAETNHTMGTSSASKTGTIAAGKRKRSDSSGDYVPASATAGGKKRKRSAVTSGSFTDAPERMNGIARDEGNTQGQPSIPKEKPPQRVFIWIGDRKVVRGENPAWGRWTPER